MQPKNFHFGGGESSTVLHPLIGVGMLIAIVLILTLSRRKAIIPFLLACFAIPIGQVMVVGVHLTMHQILILTVLARMAGFRGPKGKFAGGFNALDKVVVLWALSTTIVFDIAWMEKQALIKSLGDLIINLGGYLAVRFLIPDRDTLQRTVKVVAVISIIQGASMMSEHFTLQNVFSFAGALPPTIRDGHVRSEGAMGNLWGGASAGVMIPIFLWLWKQEKSRLAACAGLTGATAMVFATYASTPWMAYGASLLGLAFWPLRKQMRLIRWGIVSALAGLHLVMHGPVWSLIEKIDLTGGSSSYHRYELVDNCIRHFSEWWLVGCKYYNSWGFGMFDLCDQWVAVAVTGGLVTFVLYIMVFSRSFGALGNARKHVEGDRRQEWFFWCVGSALFAIVVSSFGVNFNVYLQLMFFTFLACISLAAFEVMRPAPQAQTARTPHPQLEAETNWRVVETH
jgi:hypothetical protein